MDRYRQHELPETVKRYKAYTDSFQEWLMKTAMQRGVENAAYIAAQAKKKKKKKGKGVYKLSLEQQKTLVDGITSSKEPLADTSGLRDLKDAIRSRKEVAQFHKISDTEDEGHSFLNFLLEAAYTNLMTFVQLIPVQLNTQGLEDEASTFLACFFNRDETADSEDDEDGLTENDPTEEHTPETKKRSLDDEKAQNSPQKKGTKNPLSQAETQLQRNFKVLCFLYEFNRIRGIVRETWTLYHKGTIGVISAALVTDLAQSYVQQNVAALVEDLSSSKYTSNTGFLEILQQLYTGLAVSGIASQKKPTAPQIPKSALRHIFCMDAIEQLEAHRDHKSPTEDGKSTSGESNFPFLGFLRYFDAIRKKKLKLPIWDRFTESVIRSADWSDDYLPFGFQLVLDVHEIVHQDSQQIFKDINGHGLDIAKLIRTHVDYEDKMWDIGTKPDYMSVGDVKFSNVYLTSLTSLLNWLQELLKVDTDVAFGMTTAEFFTTHATLAGLSLQSFSKTYHGFSITKVSWFVTSLAHLYNAALQVGGLKHRWPDLDYIIEMHGGKRVFVGGPPTDPQTFVDRYLMSMCISSRALAKDFRRSTKSLPRVSTEVASKKRGLVVHFPLEDAISKYYGPDQDGNRWLRRHQVFNYLKQLSSARPNTSNLEDEGTGVLSPPELRETFSDMVKKMLPPKTKKRRNRASRVQAPDFNQMEDTNAILFQVMRTELQQHELHSNFDYLAFYRRTYALVLSIREKVLFDSTQQLVRYGDVLEPQDPTNAQLLVDLFNGLKIKPHDEEIETKGDEVSKDVVPVDQLKRIAEIMGDVIKKEGSVELNRAVLRRRREWEIVKASYAREEAGEEQDLPIVSEGHPYYSQAPIVEDDSVAPPKGFPTTFPPENTQASPSKNTGSERLPGQPPQGEFTFTGPDSFVSWKSSMGSAQPIPNLANIFGKPYQAYVSDEVEEVDQVQGLEMPAPASCNEDGEDSSESPTQMAAAHDGSSNDHEAASIQREGIESDHAVHQGAESASKQEEQPDLPSATPRIPKHKGKPKGVFHRINYSSTSLRKRKITMTGKGKTARLTYSPHRHNPHCYLLSVARKRTISFKCYGRCILARKLLRKKTSLHRRQQKATKFALAQDSTAPQNLEAAWDMASPTCSIG